MNVQSFAARRGPSGPLTYGHLIAWALVPVAALALAALSLALFTFVLEEMRFGDAVRMTGGVLFGTKVESRLGGVEFGTVSVLPLTTIPAAALFLATRSSLAEALHERRVVAIGAGATVVGWLVAAGLLGTFPQRGAEFTGSVRVIASLFAAAAIWLLAALLVRHVAARALVLALLVLSVGVGVALAAVMSGDQALRFAAPIGVFLGLNVIALVAASTFGAAHVVGHFVESDPDHAFGFEEAQEVITGSLTGGDAGIYSVIALFVVAGLVAAYGFLRPPSESLEEFGEDVRIFVVGIGLLLFIGLPAATMHLQFETVGFVASDDFVRLSSRGWPFLTIAPFIVLSSVAAIAAWLRARRDGRAWAIEVDIPLFHPVLDSEGTQGTPLKDVLAAIVGRDLDGVERALKSTKRVVLGARSAVRDSVASPGRVGTSREPSSPGSEQAPATAPQEPTDDPRGSDPVRGHGAAAVGSSPPVVSPSDLSYCTNCGTRFAEGRFCAGCGQARPVTSQEKTSRSGLSSGQSETSTGGDPRIIQPGRSDTDRRTVGGGD